MSAGPAVAAAGSVPAGRGVDRFGAPRITVIGLAGMAIGCLALCLAPASLGIAGYAVPIVIVTAGYALFQTANNSAVMQDVPPDQRGVISGMLNLSRNLGLVTGASVMGAVFAGASRTSRFAAASPEAVAAGMRVTFAVAAALVFVALAIALASLALSRQSGRRDRAPAAAGREASPADPARPPSVGPA
jgi:MFS family permease